jgi:hypothetical protein
MSSLIDKIISEDFSSASVIIDEKLSEILSEKLKHIKALVAMRSFPDLVSEEIRNTRRVGRLNHVRIRVRRGKVQRRKKVSAVKGWTFRQNRLIRMRPSERLHRRLAARRAKIKRRGKMMQIRRKTAISMRRRKSLGLSYKPFGRR